MSALAAQGGTVTSGQASFSDANGIYFGISGSTITARAVPVLTLWENTPLGYSTHSTLGSSHGQIYVFPLRPDGNRLFDGVMTVQSLYLLASGSQTATSASSTSGNFNVHVGLYTLNGSTLSLLNSGSGSFNIQSGSDCTSCLHGPRWVSIATSNFSAQLSLSPQEYYMGIMISSANTSKSIAWVGYRLDGTSQHSGILGTSQVTATSQGRFPWHGQYSASSAAMPSAIQQSELDKVNATAGFAPIVAFNNLGANL
jgi:hypothetical protein